MSMGLFWLFLVRRGVITESQLAAAKDRQEGHKVPIGRLAIQEKVLSVNQVVQIITEQAETGEMFGEIGVRRGFLTPRDVHRLLDRQVALKADLGAILVEIGAVDREVLERERNAYRDFVFDCMEKKDDL